MIISTSDFKKGVRILIDGAPFLILETTTQTPSARGAATLVKIRVRNLQTGQVLDKSFKAGERFDEPDLEKRGLQYLYEEGDGVVFMDQKSYDQFTVPKDDLGDKARYLVDNLEVKALFFEGKIIDLDLPTSVEMEVMEAEPGAKGDTVQGAATKGATLSNGLRVQVPLYIKVGEMIRVSTQDGRFLERVR